MAKQLHIELRAAVGIFISSTLLTVSKGSSKHYVNAGASMLCTRYGVF
ncbi:hypothetical protein CHELA1G11_10342 [Hyphomicrobiales bacterium]|nr:hypothetical protein CHELA1G11_10342 [Hyphomicrobiales bacterium]CAH1675351.1 hypothetical protein CHELA1G2_13963 [Hyphomicrobiales bacterium]